MEILETVERNASLKCVEICIYPATSTNSKEGLIKFSYVNFHASV